MNWRLTWKVAGDPFSLTLLCHTDTSRLAMRQLHAALIGAGHDAELQRQTDGWVEVED